MANCVLLALVFAWPNTWWTDGFAVFSSMENSLCPRLSSQFSFVWVHLTTTEIGSVNYIPSNYNTDSPFSNMFSPHQLNRVFRFRLFSRVRARQKVDTYMILIFLQRDLGNYLLVCQHLSWFLVRSFLFFYIYYYDKRYRDYWRLLY